MRICNLEYYLRWYIETHDPRDQPDRSPCYGDNKAQETKLISSHHKREGTKPYW